MAQALARRRLTSSQRREQILAVAMDLFARKGFTGTTTREIAVAAGVSEALVFRSFPHKETLYAAIIQQKIQESPEDPFPEEAARRCDDREVFRHLATGMLRKMMSDPTFMRLLLRSGLEGHALAAMFYRHRIRTTLRFLETYVRRRVRSNAFRRVDPAIVARAFLGAVCNHAMMRELFRAERHPRITPEEFVDTVAEITLSGLAPGGAFRRAR